MVYFGKKGGAIPANVAKLDANNTFTGTNTFNENVNVYNDKKIKLGYDTNQIKLELEAVSGNSNGKVKAPTGNLILESTQDIILSGRTIGANNKKIVQVADPLNADHCANKRYVDSVSLPNIAAENTEYENGRQTFFGKQIYVQYISQQLDLSQTRTITITGATRIINTQLTFSHNQTPTNYAATLPFMVFNSGQTTISQAITTSFTDGTISIIPVGLSGQKYIRGFVFYVK